MWELCFMVSSLKGSEAMNPNGVADEGFSAKQKGTNALEGTQVDHRYFLSVCKGLVLVWRERYFPVMAVSLEQISCWLTLLCQLLWKPSFSSSKSVCEILCHQPCILEGFP